eukprot:4572585-Pleurochrysis_carterae.AAC.1
MFSNAWYVADHAATVSAGVVGDRCSCLQSAQPSPPPLPAERLDSAAAAACRACRFRRRSQRGVASAAARSVASPPPPFAAWRRPFRFSQLTPPSTSPLSLLRRARRRYRCWVAVSRGLRRHRYP